MKERAKAVRGVKVFSATMAKERNAIGDRVTDWIRDEHRRSPRFEILDYIVTQSSDSEFHCYTMTMFYRA